MAEDAFEKFVKPATRRSLEKKSDFDIWKEAKDEANAYELQVRRILSEALHSDAIVTIQVRVRDVEKSFLARATACASLVHVRQPNGFEGVLIDRRGQSFDPQEFLNTAEEECGLTAHEISHWMANGKKIDIIKIVWIRLGVSLKVAKEFVDSQLAKHPRQ